MARYELRIKPSVAKDLRGIVDYYERRYNIGYTEQEKQDLVNLMSVL